ncbi:hypothetical protein GALL_451910 [mine drainage metagenome]|uniref:Uncharacterized protein n=1 Tax=mine drainage metagenome TaxID=410659 RepID=A0A1J5PNV8_9ZZZZ
MRLALVVVEEHAGGPVHLRNDHPLSAVDHERAVGRHQGHVAHEHVLLLDVLDRLRAGGLVDIKHDQAQRHLQRRGIGHVAALAFLNVVFRLLQLVFHELKHRALVEILDREDRLKHALNPLAVGGLGALAGFQEQVIGGFLNLDKVRHLQNFTDFTIVAADTLLADVALSHAQGHLSFFFAGVRPLGTGRRRLRNKGVRSNSCKPSHRPAPEPKNPAFDRTAPDLPGKALSKTG